MGREIRRVPANWQHPTYANPYHGEVMKPLLNRDFAAEAADWDAQAAAWDRGERPDYFDATKYGAISFIDYHGERPDRERYVPYDVNGDLPWFQMYETVSEGTPVTPAFATADELIEHLATFGERYDDRTGSGPWDRERAEQFVRNEKWFPSFVMQGAAMYDAKSGMPE